MTASPNWMQVISPPLPGGFLGLSKFGKALFSQDEGGGGGRGGSAHAISGFKTSPQPRMGSLEGLPLIAVSLKFELLAGRLRGFLSCPLTLTPKESGNIVLMLMIRFGATTSYQSVKVGTMIPDSMRANVGEQDSFPSKEAFPLLPHAGGHRAAVVGAGG